MDARQSVNPAPLIVPSQWPGIPCPPNIFSGACTRCGRATEPGNVWSVCGSCAAGGSIAVGLSTVKQPTANCTACRVTFRVSSHYRTAHVLCPPCQVRHAAIVKKSPRDRAVPRTNPYPVVTPIAKTTRALATAVAIKYPHLPSATSASLQSVGAVAGGGAYTSVNNGEDVLRVCMRCGCGARLPVHVRCDMCEACAGAGFVHPLPAVVQKRVPRRATERTCARPLESLDLIRASLSREAAHDAKVATERKDVENESEADLVYPDGIPLATQYASTTSESKREKPKPIEDEDAELELVYPEDVAKATWISSLKPRTKLSPPATLRELFKDGLQTIPALQDLTVPADKSPPRHCRTPGCNEALMAQTRMERCVKCSVGDWKRRKLAAMDTPEPSRCPSTSSPTTDTSMEEKEVATMLDEISDVEDGSDLPPPPPSSPSKGSRNELTGGHGVSPIPGWDSDLTELSSSDSDAESVSDSGPEPGLRPARPHGDTTGLRIHIPLLSTRLPPGNSFRKCGNKRCNIALPKDHRWKTCDPCRRAQKIRLENKRKSMMGIERSDLSCRRWRSLSPDMCETHTTLTPKTSRPCSVKYCRSRIPLPEVYRWKTCTRCRAKARQEARRKQDALLETKNASCPLEVVPRFPAHQNRGALLSSFDAQLKGFMEGQIMYFRAKLHDSEGGGHGESEPWKPEHPPMMFVFVGEYSIVTGQRGDSERNSHDRDHPRWRDNPAELEAMRQEVSSVVLDLERVLRGKFRTGEAFAIDKGGILMQFTCSLELIAQLRPLTTAVGPGPGLSSASNSEANASKDKNAFREDGPLKPPPKPPAVPLVKALSGELEAVVVPDESHRLFHGRRTVIRYRMVG